MKDTLEERMLEKFGVLYPNNPAAICIKCKETWDKHTGKCICPPNRLELIER